MISKTLFTTGRRSLILAGLITVFATSGAWCDGPSSVVISEIAWMGTAASASDEWIELQNRSGEAIALAGWRLEALDGTPSIPLEGEIAPGGLFLLERTDDKTVSDIAANLIYAGLLENGGESLMLIDAEGHVVDEVCCVDGWFAGSAAPDYTTMERVNPNMDGLATNWGTNTGDPTCGRDADGTPIHGTPGAANSVTRPPTASFDYAPQTPTVWDTVLFADRSVDDEELIAWFWVFGDEATSDVASPAHRFAALGTHLVTLRVTDNHGLTDETSHVVVIGAGPGDLNDDGAIDLLDVRLCYRIASGLLVPTSQQKEAADVTGDGIVDMADVECLADHVLGI